MSGNSCHSFESGVETDLERVEKGKCVHVHVHACHVGMLLYHCHTCMLACAHATRTCSIFLHWPSHRGGRLRFCVWEELSCMLLCFNQEVHSAACASGPWLRGALTHADVLQTASSFCCMCFRTKVARSSHACCCASNCKFILLHVLQDLGCEELSCMLMCFKLQVHSAACASNCFRTYVVLVGTAKELLLLCFK